MSFLTQFLSKLKANGKTLIIATHEERQTQSLADQVLDLGEWCAAREP
jgi:ABC-type siderophore export system fused ATPase/permease subunit